MSDGVGVAATCVTSLGQISRLPKTAGARMRSLNLILSIKGVTLL